MNTTTTGSGMIILEDAIAGYLSFNDAGAQDSELISYGIINGNNSELGIGLYSGSNMTIERNSILSSTNSGSHIILSGNSEVYIPFLSENIPTSYPITVTIWPEVLNTSVTMSKTFNASAEYGYYYGPSAANANNGDEYLFYVFLETGYYYINMLGILASSCGQVDYYVDDVLIYSGQDWYNSSSVYSITKRVSCFCSVGTHTVKIKVNGKNASSSDYRVLFEKIWIEKISLSVAKGAFEYWQIPSSIYYSGSYNRTYISWISTDGKIQICYYDHDEGVFSSIATVHNLFTSYGVEAIDDHNAPSLIVLPDGKIKIFYSVHDVNSAFFTKTSEFSEDISSWTSTTDISDGVSTIYNYPCPFYFSTGSMILFYRRGSAISGNWHIKTSSDDGETWTSSSTIVDFNSTGVYLTPTVSDDDQIHVAINEYLSSSPYRRDIYYMKSDDYGQSWKKADNSNIEIPASSSSLDLVYDSLSATRPHDIISISGSPHIIFSNNVTGCEYRYAKFSSGSWMTYQVVTSEVLYGSSPYYYTGGALFLPTSASTVFLSKKYSHFEIEKWETEDDGETWSLAEEITNNSSVDNFRPKIVNNFNEELRLVWCSGRYEGLISGQWTGYGFVNIQCDITKSGIP